MILTYVEQTKLYVLSVERWESPSPDELVKDYGFDFSVPRSTADTAVLFTDNPYTAAPFAQHGDENARRELDWITRAVAESSAARSNAHFAVPMDRELWDFQGASLSYLLKRGGGLDGDQPGLGKTPTAICFANEIKAKRVLVICPASIRLQWATRIREWSTMRWPYVVYPILNSGRGVHPTAEWTIVSYELARSEGIGHALARGTYDLIILDEAHMLKTPDSNRTRAIFGDYETGRFRKKGSHEPMFDALASRAGSVLALTGTPLLNRPREAYTLGRALCLSAETQVLTSNGVKPICSVTREDKVWDGSVWVNHAGLVFQGVKQTVAAFGLSATAEHRVLTGTQWFPWSDVTQDENTRFQAWVTGLESLKLLVTHLAEEEQISSSDATVVLDLVKWCSTIYCEEKTPNVLNAEIETYLDWLSAKVGIRKLWRTLRCEIDCSEKSASRLEDAMTPKTEGTSGMGPGVSVCGRHGKTTNERISPISCRYRASRIETSTSIEQITTGDTNQGICGSSRGQPISEIEEPLFCSNNGFPNLKPVYDIVNAGPNRRFTILTPHGPLVVSNCWDAYDWMSEDRFNARFNPRVKKTGTRADGSEFIYIDERTGRHQELQYRMRGNFMARHLKREVMTQLKWPIYDLIRVEETGPVKQALQAESLLQIDPDNFDPNNIKILGHISAVRKMMGIAIAPQVADWVDDLIEGGEEKLVVFAWHIEVLNILERRFQKHGCLRIDGSVGAFQKQEIVDEFQRDPRKQVLIGNMQAMGVGTDGLQHVSCHALLAEPDWVPGNNEQAVDRLDRGGQKWQVQADIFVAPNSVCEKILASALKKGQVIHSALDKRYG